jgi:hypothetical protein
MRNEFSPERKPCMERIEMDDIEGGNASEENGVYNEPA